jgi:Hsp20/alpha crystallin family
MALPPAPRNGTLSRPGSQAPARCGPFAESGDLHQRTGQLTSGASGGWQPPARSRAPLAGRELVISGEFRQPGQHGRALRRGRRPGRPGYRVLVPGPAEADKVTAALTDGVLTVTAPRAEADQPRRIQVTAA